ncbi:MAG: precorrin-6A reductase [Lachnospiraceae bacterium]|nr:precorrin-6A reductase [Lachnospiraceae bacterium]
MNILIFAGTSDGRELSYRLAEKYDVTVSVATEYGRELEESYGKPGRIKVLSGRMAEDEMEKLMKGFDACIDATHPYAVEAGKNIKMAAKNCGIRLFRLGRKACDIPEEAAVFGSAAEAAEYLKEKKGNVLVATGAKEIKEFTSVGMDRLTVRILPAEESLRNAKEAGLGEKNILTGMGPFSKEDNIKAIKERNIEYFVTKDGGTAGGFPEKADACRECDIQMVVIKRPEGRNGMDAGEIIEELENIYNN